MAHSLHVSPLVEEKKVDNIPPEREEQVGQPAKSVSKEEDDVKLTASRRELYQHTVCTQH